MSAGRVLGAAVCALTVAVAGLLPAAAVTNPAAPPLCGTAPGGNSAGGAGPLRIASYNVLHGLTEGDGSGLEPGINPEYPTHSTLDQRAPIAADEIDASGADLLGVQEASRSEDLDGHHVTVNQIARIAELLADPSRTGVDWHWCWFLANPKQVGEPDMQTGGGGPLSERNAQRVPGPYNGSADPNCNLPSPSCPKFREGVGVLSKYPITASEGIRLPARLPLEHAGCGANPGCQLTVPFESRAAIWARVATRDGVTHVLSTHLAHGLTAFSDHSALVQAAAALAFERAKAEEAAAAGTPAARRLFLCDCNSLDPGDTGTPEVPVIQTIKDAGFTDTYRSAHPNPATHPGATGGPDTILTSSAVRAGALAHSERIDYVFWRAGACGGGPMASVIFGDTPQQQPSGNWLWASDHLGVATDLSTMGC